MAVPVTVVDDSKISRKMVIRALTKEWDINITQAILEVTGAITGRQV